jgi:hypothetical protein
VKLADRQAYKALPDTLRAVLKLTDTANGLPLDASLAACDRVAAAGCYNSPTGTMPVSAELAAQQRRLIELAREFRDGCVAVLTAQATEAAAQM